MNDENELLEEPTLNLSQATTQIKERAHELSTAIAGGDIEMDSLAPLLNFFRIKGKVYNLDDHYQFEPMFALRCPRRSIFKCSRQVGKSQNTAASEVLKSWSIEHFRTLMVCPRFEQIKRLSTLYVQSFINESKVKNLLIDSSRAQSVLQRTFEGGSVHYYSFAFLDAERIRSISSDQVIYDEIQDMNFEFLPIIEQTMGGSKHWRMQRYTGTPKSKDNTAEKLWKDSSQHVWSVQCEAQGCGYWNIGCIEEDLLDMIGPTTAICAKCGKPINPRRGLYIPKYPERTNTFSGFHISQPMHPFYFEIEENWLEMLGQMKRYPTSKFYNECLGEAWDSADRLITTEQIWDVSVSERRNVLDEALKLRQKYSLVSMGIDWGGGGDDSPSYTVLTVVGQRPGTDICDIIYSLQLPKSLGPFEECQFIVEYFKKFKPTFISHDYTGAGNVREAILLQLGIPSKRLMPFTYVHRPTNKIINFESNDEFSGTRSSYTIDKTRSIVVLAAMIKARKITFPNADDHEDFNQHLVSLMEERTDRPRGSPIVTIATAAGESDDFAHALNLACSGIWYSEQRYPDMAEALALELTMEDLRQINPTEEEFNQEESWEISDEEKGWDMPENTNTTKNKKRKDK